MIPMAQPGAGGQRSQAQLVVRNKTKEYFMKHRNNSPAFLAMLALGSAAILGGCTSTGIDRSTRTSNSIRDVDGEIRNMIVELDVTGTSLDSLVIPGNPDLKRSFDAYSGNLARLERNGQRALKRMDEMAANSKDYFEEWKKEGDSYTNPQIRALSEERRTKLAGLYAQVPAAGSGIKRAYLDCLTNFKEIQRYLSTDLTPEAVKAIAPVAQKAITAQDSLRRSLKPVVSALDEIGAELFSPVPARSGPGAQQ